MKLMSMRASGSLILAVLPELIGKTIVCFFFEFIANFCLFSTLTTDVVPSFILLAIQGSKVVTYVYELHGDQVDVSKSEFSKA